MIHDIRIVDGLALLDPADPAPPPPSAADAEAILRKILAANNPSSSLEQEMENEGRLLSAAQGLLEQLLEQRKSNDHD